MERQENDQEEETIVKYSLDNVPHQNPSSKSLGHWLSSIMQLRILKFFGDISRREDSIETYREISYVGNESTASVPSPTDLSY